MYTYILYYTIEKNYSINDLQNKSQQHHTTDPNDHSRIQNQKSNLEFRIRFIEFKNKKYEKHVHIYTILYNRKELLIQ